MYQLLRRRTAKYAGKKEIQFFPAMFEHNK